MIRKLLLTASVLALLLGAPAWAQIAEEGPALDPLGMDQKELEARLAKDYSSYIDLLRTMGLVVFTTPFNTMDGLGDGPFNSLELPNTVPGHRPTLQGNGAHLRINGLDAQSCNECHSLVSHATVPPTLGIGGAGTVAQSAFPRGTLLDIADTFENRISYVPGHNPDLPLVFDGVADYNGRFINAPFLFGGGGVELIAKEMTQNLQAILYDARHGKPGEVWSLLTHGVDFGFLVSLGHHQVELHLDGIGLENPGVYSPEPATPAEEHLVVRPFGRKGEAFSMRDFDRGAMQFHFGMQPTEVVGTNVDDDLDGVVDEVTDAEMSVLHIFDVTNPPPFMEPLDPDSQIGYDLFRFEVGCSDCHYPEIRSEYQDLPLAHPEDPLDPWNKNVYVHIPLTQFGFAPDPFGTGVIVPLFSDLKRHDMGPDLAETCEGCDVPNEDFITARLWGIADTAPYLHDGRATTLREAIEAHGGDAQDARDKFLDLSAIDQIRLIEFLRRLRTPPHPNEDILP